MPKKCKYCNCNEHYVIQTYATVAYGPGGADICWNCQHS